MELTADTDLVHRLCENDQSCLEDSQLSFGSGILIPLRRRFHDALREEDLDDVLLVVPIGFGIVA